MNRVNPPKQLQLPESIRNNPDLKKAFDDRDYILNQMWKRTGGGSDNISDLFSEFLQFDELNKFNKEDRLLVSYNDNSTMSGGEVATCGNIEISLNPTPQNMEKATVKLVDGDVEIFGNGNTIDEYDSVKVIYTSFQGKPSIDFIYSADLGRWLMV